MSETKDDSSEKSTQEHPIDVSYIDETGAAEILHSQSSYMFTTDGSVDLNVCSVSDKGRHSLCLRPRKIWVMSWFPLGFVVRGIRSHKQFEDYMLVDFFYIGSIVSPKVYPANKKLSSSHTLDASQDPGLQDQANSHHSLPKMDIV